MMHTTRGCNVPAAAVTSTIASRSAMQIVRVRAVTARGANEKNTGLRSNVDAAGASAALQETTVVLRVRTYVMECITTRW